MAIETMEQRITTIARAINEAAGRAGRAPGSVTVVAVCKTATRAAVDEAYAAGLRHFGENRVPDAIAKFAGAPLPADADLHMIGQLQTNKAGKAVGLFQVIESVDRLSLVHELERLGARRERAIPVLLQVNVAGEEQKAGCDPADVDGLLDAIAAARYLDLQGLMTIAPLVADPEEVRPVFRGLRELRDGLRAGRGLALPVLSMGMSNDYPVAIEEGATHVRIGRAIFGS